MSKDAYFYRELCRRALTFPSLVFAAALACAEPAVLLETTRLMPADGAPNAGFARSVAIDGNVAVVGATVVDFPVSGSYQPGAAYVFERNSQGVWQQTAKLTGCSPPMHSASMSPLTAV